MSCSKPVRISVVTRWPCGFCREWLQGCGLELHDPHSSPISLPPATNPDKNFQRTVFHNTALSDSLAGPGEAGGPPQGRRGRFSQREEDNPDKSGPVLCRCSALLENDACGAPRCFLSGRISSNAVVELPFIVVHSRTDAPKTSELQADSVIFRFYTRLPVLP